MSNYEYFNIQREKRDDYIESFNTKDAPKKELHPFIKVALRVIKIACIVLLITTILWTFLVHPADKLKIKLLLAKNCEIKASAFLGNETRTIQIDENILFYKGEYYEIYENGEVYKHEKWLDTWVMLPSSEFSSSYEDQRDFEILIDRNNYERVEGKLFTWVLKPGIEAFDHRRITLKNNFGKYEFGIGYVKLTIQKIGLVHIDKPWE